MTQSLTRRVLKQSIFPAGSGAQTWDARRVRRFLAGLAEARTAFGGVLRNPALRRLELAWACSIVGAWAYGVAVVVYAFQHGGARAVESALGHSRAGVPVRRRPRRPLRPAPRHGGVGPSPGRAHRRGRSRGVRRVRAVVRYVVAGLVSVAGTPFRPAEAAYTPVLTNTPEELSAANVVAAAIESIGIFAGPALGGLLLAATNTGTVFVATAALVGASAVLIVGIRAGAEERPPGPSAESVLGELLAGARTIASDRKGRATRRTLRCADVRRRPAGSAHRRDRPVVSRRGRGCGRVAERGLEGSAVSWAPSSPE